jgi:uncharacterized protein
MLDLQDEYITLIKTILLKYVANYEVWIFGSRVNGKAKKYSDVDLVIITDSPLPVLTMALLKEDFSASNLPYKVDVLDWSEITTDFKELILKNYLILYRPE